MQIERLAVDNSVSVLFPPEILLDELAGLPVETTIFEQSQKPLSATDGVVTFTYHDSLLDAGWVHSVQAGVDRFPFDQLQQAETVLTNSTGIHGDAIGETVAGYMLALARRLHTHVADQQDRRWSQPEWEEAWTIAGETTCVIGLGGLGRGIVDRVTGLGLDVVGVRRTPTPEPGVEKVYTPANLLEAVSGARFVVLAVPMTEQTKRMIDREVFEAMREDAYLVNVARGGVVDQDALVDALQAEMISGAALDVFETEPLPESSPLWEMDEVIVSPHCGAFTQDYPQHVAGLVRENVTRFRTDEEPVNRVV